MDWGVFDSEPGRSLERALLDSPHDSEAWTVYADFLASHAPRLSERIMLEVQRDAARPDESAFRLWDERVRQFDLEHRGEWLDPRLRRLFGRHKTTPAGVALRWSHGFVVDLGLGPSANTKPPFDQTLARVLGSPLSRFLTSLTIDCSERSRRERLGVRQQLRDAAPRPTLHELGYRDPQGPVSLPELLRFGPRLRHLSAKGELCGEVVRHPELRTLALAFSRAQPWPQLERALDLPKLVELRLDCWGLSHRGVAGLLEMLERMFSKSGLPKLERLDIAGLWGATDGIVELLARLDLLAGLVELRHATGQLGSAGASALLSAARQGRGLSRLRVGEWDLSAAEERQLAASGLLLLDAFD